MAIINIGILNILKRINDSLVNKECEFNDVTCIGCCNLEQCTERHNIGIDILEMMKTEVSDLEKLSINFMGFEG
jgi:hypothetical protein